MSDEATTAEVTPSEGQPTAAVDGALRGKVTHALRWSFINSVVTRLSQLGLSIALAHIIAPREFGVFAVALVVINITLSISELGASVALVRHEGDPDELAPTVATISVISSGVLALLTVLLAPVIADALGAPEATGVVRLLAVALLSSGFAAVPGAMLQRNFRQDHKMAADTASFVLSTLVVVVLALAGFGPWALAWSRIVANVSAAVVMTRLSKQPFRLGFDRAQARSILSFSLPLAGASLLVFAVMNVDYIVIGAVLGPVQLGYYLIAFNLSSWPVNAFSSTIRTVSVAGFAQLQGDRDVRRESFAASLGLLMSLATPACVLLAVFAHPLIRFVYGDRWEPAASALVALAGLGALRVALELAYDFLAAVGSTRAILALHALWLGALIPALALGAHWSGIAGVGIGHIVVVGALVTPAYVVGLARADVPLRSYVARLVRPLIGAGAMVAVGLVVGRSIDADFWVLAIGCTLAVLTYAAVVLPGSPAVDVVRRRLAPTH